MQPPLPPLPITLREAFFLSLAQLSYLCKNPDEIDAEVRPTMTVAHKNYLIGHLYNVLDEYHREAEEHLSRAVKLNPSSVDTWNSLGECFWKKGDLNTARMCFSTALDRAKNKTSLRSMSMVLRQLGEDDSSRRSNISQSVELAKQALTLDIDDGISWSKFSLSLSLPPPPLPCPHDLVSSCAVILGNAYLSYMFNCSLRREDLNKALNAYEKAKYLEKSRNHPDLYYNQSTVREKKSVP